jgi:excisionase family DNA binding protein
MPLPDKPLFTVKETAEYLGIPQAQVYQLCRSAGLASPRFRSLGEAHLHTPPGH